MALTILFSLSIILFFLFRFKASPWIEVWAASDLSQKGILKTAVSSFVQFTTLFFLLLTLTFGTLLLALTIFTSIEYNAAPEIRSWIDGHIIPLRTGIEGLSQTWGILFTAFLFVSMAMLSGCTGYAWRYSRHETAKSRRLRSLETNSQKKPFTAQELADRICQTNDDLLSAEDEFATVVRSANEDTKRKLRVRLCVLSERLEILTFLNQESPTLTQKDIRYDIPDTPCHRLGTVFLSRGLLNIMLRGKLWLFMLGVLLSIPPMLAIPVEEVRSRLDAYIAKLEIMELQVTLDAFVQDDQSLDNKTTVDQTIIDQFTTDIEMQLLGAPFRVNRDLTRDRRVEEAWRNYRIRDEILKAASQGRGKNGAAGPSTHGPSNDFRTRFSDRVRDLAKDYPDYWKEFVVSKFERIGSQFSEPIDLRAIYGAFVSEAIGEAISGISTETTGGRLVRDTLAGGASAFSNAFVSHLPLSFFVSAQRGRNVEDIINRVALSPMPFTARPNIEKLDDVFASLGPRAILEFLEKYPPYYRIEPYKELANYDRSKMTQYLIWQKSNGIRQVFGQTTLLDGLGTFDDFFPGQIGADRRTPRAEIIREFKLKKPPIAESFGSRFIRARSYGQLQGFARVGGVLIGRNFEPGSRTLDFVDLEWWLHEDSNQIDLIFEDHSGGKVKFNGVDSSTVNLALAYAADGRPVAVTIINGSPFKNTLRVLLHPVLQDTTLGCAAIHLDQFVNSLEDEEILQTRQEMINQNLWDIALYEAAWAVRYKALKSSLGNDSPANNVHSALFEVLDLEAKRIEEQQLDQQELTWSGKGTVVSERTDFFDRRLVEHVRICANDSDQNKEFVLCIRKEVKNSLNQYKNDQLDWAAPPPKVARVSGVRESSYKLESDLWFSEAQKDEGVWPFRFVVQILFASPPWFEERNQSWFDHSYGDRAAATEILPWNIDFGGRLNHAVRAEIDSNEEKKRVFEKFKQFVLMQRIFRVALQGALGHEFPTEKLIVLARATAINPKDLEPTTRWLPQKILENVESEAEFRRLLASPNVEKLSNAVGVNVNEKRCRMSNH